MCSSIEEALPDADVLYMTRIQKERFLSDEQYQLSVSSYAFFSPIYKAISNCFFDEQTCLALPTQLDVQAGDYWHANGGALKLRPWVIGCAHI